MSKIAISYARFSSAPQAQGASLARQIERARDYAEVNGLVLDPGLCFQDLGVSAWDQSNIEKGALGLFLEAVRVGRVPAGATLIVESFDRLSRATPLDAFQVFSTILTSGLKLAILTAPPQVFSRASVSENPMQLMLAIAEMTRANSESDHKSRRVADAWVRRRAAGAESKSGVSANPPMWMVKRKDGRACTYELIPERVAVVKQVIQWSLAGVGNHTIVTKLHSAGIAPWVRSQAELDRKNAKRAEQGMPPKQPGWEPSYIQKLTTSPALYGAVRVKGGDVIEDVYPAVLSKDDWLFLQAKRSAKAKRKASNRKGKNVANLFGGMMFCGYCNSAMIINGYTDRKTKKFQRYYACQGSRTGNTDCRMHGWPVTELEDSVLFWMSQVNFNEVLGNTSTGMLEEARKQLAVLTGQQAELERRIANVAEAIMDGAKGMASMHNKLSTELEGVQQLVADQEKHVALLERQDGPGSTRMDGLITLFKALKHTTDDTDLRMVREQVASAVAQVVKSITLHPVGWNAGGTLEDRFADIRFTNDAERRLEPAEC